MGDEDGDQPRGSAVVRIGGPDDLVAVGKCEDVDDEVQEGGFVVGAFFCESSRFPSASITMQ